MPKFNIKPGESFEEEYQTAISHPRVTENYERGIAFTQEPDMELYTRVSTSLVGENKYYESGGESDSRIIQLIHHVADKDPKFVLQLAIHARNTLNLRSIPIMLLGEASLDNNAKPFVRAASKHIIQRADELTEMLSYMQAKLGDFGDGNLGGKDAKKAREAPMGKLPNSMKKALAMNFGKFDEYQLAKYNKRGSKVKLKDVLRLTHPKPVNDEQSKLWKRVIDDKLETPDTWETMITTRGSTAEAWTDAAKVMPIMALIRNLRNILQHVNHEGTYQNIIDKLHNKNTIINSKQFPFRFLSAYREVQNADLGGLTDIGRGYHYRIMRALSDAALISAQNIPHLDGASAIFADNSGSMDNQLSDKGTTRRMDVANLLMMISNKICDKSFCGIFGETFKAKNYDATEDILKDVLNIQNGEVGHSTNAYLALDHLNRYKMQVDRIIVFSDEQCYDTHGYGAGGSVIAQLLHYRKNINPNCRYYGIDLAGYGTTQVPNDDPLSLKIAGWSDKILEYIPLSELDKKSALEMIRKIEI